MLKCQIDGSVKWSVSARQIRQQKWLLMLKNEEKKEENKYIFAFPAQLIYDESWDSFLQLHNVALLNIFTQF